MLNIKLDFKCRLCGEKDKFYIMPLDEKTPGGDYIHSNDKWRVVCKKCGQNHLIRFSYTISLVERTK